MMDLESPHAELVAEVADWLRGRRTEICRRTETAGLPTTVNFNIPVAEPDGAGIASTDSQRSGTIFADSSNVRPLVLREVCSPLLDSQGENLAQRLAATFGDRLRFYSGIGPGAVIQDLEHPSLIPTEQRVAGVSGRLPERVPSSAPILYGLLLLRQCLVEYLGSLASLNTDDEGLVDQLASSLIRFSASEFSLHVGRVPLGGLDFDGDSISAGPCTIRRLNPEELGHLFWRRHQWFYQHSPIRIDLPNPVLSNVGLDERVVLEVCAWFPKREPGTVAPACERLLLAMILNGWDFSGEGFGIVLEEPYWARRRSFGSYSLTMPRQSSGTSPMFVTAEHLSLALNLSELIPEPESGLPASASKIALQRFGLGVGREEPAQAIVDFVVALEALLLPGDETEGARRRFALNGAVYLGKTAAERRKLYNELLDIYQARSTLVHGTRAGSTSAKRIWTELASRRRETEELTKRMLRKAVTTDWTSEETFIHALLDDPSVDSQSPLESGEAAL